MKVMLSLTKREMESSLLSLFPSIMESIVLGSSREQYCAFSDLTLTHVPLGLKALTKEVRNSFTSLPLESTFPLFLNWPPSLWRSIRNSLPVLHNFQSSCLQKGQEGNCIHICTSQSYPITLQGEAEFPFSQEWTVYTVPQNSWEIMWLLFLGHSRMWQEGWEFGFIYNMLWGWRTNSNCKRCRRDITTWPIATPCIVDFSEWNPGGYLEDTFERTD